MTPGEKQEIRFAHLVKLALHPGTPKNERSAAALVALRFFERGDLQIVSTERWQELTELFSGFFASHPPRPSGGCVAPINLGGVNGWQCCQCGARHTSAAVTPGSSARGRRGRPADRCGCGHSRCDEMMLDPSWKVRT